MAGLNQSQGICTWNEKRFVAIKNGKEDINILVKTFGYKQVDQFVGQLFIPLNQLVNQ